MRTTRCSCLRTSSPRTTSSIRCATVAKSHDATPSQVALAWVVSHPNVVAIPGASTLAQLESNVAAADLQLRDDELAELTAASDAFRPVRGPAATAKIVKRRIRR